MTEENRSFLLAILLSLAVLVGWNVFVAAPRIEDEQRRQVNTSGSSQIPKTAEQPTAAAPAAPTTPGTTTTGKAPTGLGQALPATGALKTRAQAIASSDRVAIETPSLNGSINLKGALLDDLVMLRYRETTDKDSPAVPLLTPIGAKDAYYVEHGWANSEGTVVGPNTVWTAETSGSLTPSSPVTLRYDNGKGLVFRRTISVDDNYMFTVRQEVENKGGETASLFPYAFSSRHGTPKTENIWILHEGLVGVSEKEGLTEVTYDDAIEAKRSVYEGKGGWIAITDK